MYRYKHKKHDWERKRRRRTAIQQLGLGCLGGLMFGLVLGLMFILPA